MARTFNLIKLMNRWDRKYKMQAVIKDHIQGITIKEYRGALHIFSGGEPVCPVSVVDPEYRNDLPRLLEACRSAHRNYKLDEIQSNV